MSIDELREGRDSPHVYSKNTTNFGNRNFVTFPPRFLPTYLAHEAAIHAGTMSATDAARRAPQPVSDVDLLEFIRSRNLYFDQTIAARYVASLIAKPFVILCGSTGTGKTKLAQVVAEYYTRSGGPGAASDLSSVPVGDELVLSAPLHAADPARVAFVPVRPDWTETSHVLGYYNPLVKRYEETAILRLMRHAHANPDLPHFLILDELNLAKVEYYFADFLSCMESRTPVPLHDVTEKEASGVPQRLEVPLNLYITGTVNVDETTQSLSPKVLDRAHVLEFDDVDLDGLRGTLPSPKASGASSATLPRTLGRHAPASAPDYKGMPATIHEVLKAVNAILGDAQFRLGYRSACEVAAFVKAYGGMLATKDQSAVVDAVILQKVLPRLHGGRLRLEEPLQRLRYLLWTGKAPAGQLHSGELPGSCVYPSSHRRVDSMLKALATQGFVTFFR